MVIKESYSLSSMDDLEKGGSGSEHSVLRAQSKKLSDMIVTHTELHELNTTTPDPPSPARDDEKDISTSGLKYWLYEIETAKEHGGDYNSRLNMAIRAALGSFLTFACLIFPHQQILGAVWIGNIFFHSNISTSFGASITNAQGFAKSILLTTMFSWPVAFFMNYLSVFEASVLLPFVSFIMTFVIMSCPQLSHGRNLMILVMYIIIATNVREKDLEWWEPFGWTATYLIGLCVAILMNVVPCPNLALTTTHSLLKRMEKDLTMLLLQCKAYADHTANTPDLSRSAIASIELLQIRITKTVKTLKTKLPAAKVELSWRCNTRASLALTDWINQADKLQTPLKNLRTTLVQRVLGEEYALYSSTLRDAKRVIAEEIADDRNRLVDAMIAGVAVCGAWADPASHHAVLPDVVAELEDALFECRNSFHRAMALASETLGTNPQKNTPVFAHLTRRMSAFNALFEFGDCLLGYLRSHTWEDDDTSHKNRRIHAGPCDYIMGGLLSIIDFAGPQWLWHNPDSFRLAFKTSVGMFLASLFVSVPFLWDISMPFGVWPGLTIASVNLASTGSSFHKASDRLFGTLLAAAYALLVSDLFPGNMDFVKIPAIAFFTFVVVYLRNADHAYKFTYAATSIGSMLYGSVKNDFNIAGYIPKRIELIFVGIVIFSLVELLLFPRSSRKIVETKGFQIFLEMRNFLKQAAICTQRMEHYVHRSEKDEAFLTDSLFDDTYDAFQLDKLEESHKKLKAETSKLKKELESGIVEPHVGLSLPLDAEAFRVLTKEQCDCEVYALLLFRALKQVAVFCKEPGHPIREMQWPKLHTTFLKDALQKSEFTCEWLKTAFPDGRLRAQNGNSVKAVTSAASFRGFEDVRLRTISGWSENYSTFMREKGQEGSDPVAVMTLGITTTYILEICRHLQKAGLQVEHIARNFPAVK